MGFPIEDREILLYHKVSEVNFDYHINLNYVITGITMINYIFANYTLAIEI